MNLSANLVFDARTMGDHYPGIGRYAYGLWQALDAHITTTLIDPTLRNTRFTISGSTRPGPSVRALSAQFTIPRNLQPSDLYYSPYWLMPYALPCPSVVTLYDATPLYGHDMSAFNKIIFRLAHRLVGRIAKRAIVLSESARAEMVGLGVPAHKIQVCPPGLDPKFQPATSTEVQRVKQKYNLPDEFWLCFGSKRWHKNTLAAIQALQGRPLVIVGDYDPAPLRHRAVAQLWAGQVASTPVEPFAAPSRVLPFVADDDLPALYTAAQGLVFPSLREGFGLPIIEALACGTPVACLPAPGVREAAGKAAVVAHALSPEALFAAIHKLDDPKFREAKREAGLAWAKQFTWDKTVSAITDF
jgi:glycosyltransferase involved in cell wall biosynthesis